MEPCETFVEPVGALWNPCEGKGRESALSALGGCAAQRGRGASQLSQFWGRCEGEGTRVSLVSFGGAQRGRGASRSSMALPGSARVVCPAGWSGVV